MDKTFSRYFEDDYQKILLLRHGELDSGGRAIYVGQADIPLSDKGLQQARDWALALKNIPLAKIVSSDLSRCADTARIIAHERDIELELEPGFREISFGDWDGRDKEAVKAEFGRKVEARYRDFVSQRPPNGENFADLKKRVTRVFNTTLARNRNGALLIVAHAGVNRTLLAHFMGLEAKNIFRIFQDYACLNIIDAKNGEIKHVRALNLTLA